MEFDIAEALKYMKNFINTYENQRHYKSYTMETWLHDMLYGIGVSIDKNYSWAGGYDEFKKFLIESFQPTIHNCNANEPTTKK